MPRRYYQRQSPAPPPEPEAPTTETLLAQAEALTRLARTTWITVILGCLYVWIAIAALRDIQLFLPSETLTLPILNIGISPVGFFVFAPLLLLSVFIYLHLILIRLWRVYRDLGGSEGVIQGMSVADRVPPWMLGHVLQQKGRSFDWLGHLIAVFFGWIFAPLTIFALGYRYLRAHDADTTALHSGVAAVAIVAAIAFWLAKYRILHGKGQRHHVAFAAAGVVCLWPLLFTSAQLLFQKGDIHPSFPRFLTARAQLYAAELSRTPEDWEALRVLKLQEDIATFENCSLETAITECVKDDSRMGLVGIELSRLRNELRQHHELMIPAKLGHEIPLSISRSLNSLKELCDGYGAVSTAKDLRNAILSNTNLINANLVCADLRGADLSGARLEQADLIGARVDGSSLAEVSLMNVNLSFVDLRNGEMGGARLAGSRFFRADLSFSNLSGAILQGADLREANLTGANLSAAKLEEANVSGAILSRIDLSEARLQNSDISYSKIDDAYLVFANLSSSDFHGADFSRSVLMFSKFVGSNFNLANFHEAILNSADLSASTLNGTNLDSADLRGARLNETLILNSIFTKSILVGTRIENSVIIGANFGETDLGGLSLEGSALRNVDFRNNKNLEQETINDSFGDNSVVLPEYIQRPAHWPRAILGDNISFFGRWRAWRESMDLPWPPSGKALESLATFEAVAPKPGE